MNSETCYQCGRSIDTKDDTQWCPVLLVDQFGVLATNESEEELVASICLECGHEFGAATVAELRVLDEETERKEIQ